MSAIHSMLARTRRQKELEGDISAGRVGGLTAGSKPKKAGAIQNKPRIKRRSGILR